MEKKMKQKIQTIMNHMLHSHTIFIQLLIFTLIVSIVPLILLSSLLASKIGTLITNELIRSQKQITSQYIANIESSFFLYTDSLKQISNNTIVLDTMAQEDSQINSYTKGSKISKEVQKSLRLESHKELRNCIIYSHVTENPTYGSRVAMLEQATRESWYPAYRASGMNFFTYPSEEAMDIILSLTQNIIYLDTMNFKSRQIGFVKLDILTSSLFAPSYKEGVNDYPFDVLVLNKNNQILYSSNAVYNDVPRELSVQELTDKQINYYKDTMFSQDEISQYGLKVITFFNVSQLNQKKKETYLAVFPLMAVIIVIVSLCVYLFTRSFSKRVEMLVHKIQVAETGDLTINQVIDGNDEIAILDAHFNHMLIKLNKLIQKNYIQRLEQKETELRNLQLQINPHFLYNTLETISSMAAVKHIFSICEMCEKLGEIFRYSLGKNHGEYVTVAQELAHTQNYIYIQKTRFGNKFEVFYNIEPEVEKKRILCFILQPIVENAIVHGLKSLTSQGTLEISIYLEDKNLMIKVEDDGVGMDAERVEHLNTYINEQNSQPEQGKKIIGIRNVNQRIQLTCGTDYGIYISSQPHSGACFLLTLPLLSQEEGEIL